MISTKRDQDFYNDRYHEYRTNVRFTDENDLISDVVTLIAGESWNYSVNQVSVSNKPSEPSHAININPLTMYVDLVQEFEGCSQYLTDTDKVFFLDVLDLLTLSIPVYQAKI